MGRKKRKHQDQCLFSPLSDLVTARAMRFFGERIGDQEMINAADNQEKAVMRQIAAEANRQLTTPPCDGGDIGDSGCA
jgi:aspartate/tyrosine/aromatic aminotransferase